MQTSRFHLGLIATLAVGLGFSLSSSEAIGYPAGTAVSLGANPVWSTGGTLSADVIISAGADHDLIITDFFFGREGPTSATTYIERPDGVRVAQFFTWGYDRNGHYTGANMTSGVRVPAGDSVTLRSTNSVNYTLSGYYAQP